MNMELKQSETILFIIIIFLKEQNYSVSYRTRISKPAS